MYLGLALLVGTI
jgi:hypothetical protein